MYRDRFAFPEIWLLMVCSIWLIDAKNAVYCSASTVELTKEEFSSIRTPSATPNVVLRRDLEGCE